MSSNSLGNVLTLTTFGESHGPAIGGILDGFPAGIALDISLVQRQLDRRKPGQSALSTARKESDTVEVLSGMMDGKSTGAPIAFMLKNEDQRSKDYSNLKDVYRPGHADYTYQAKYGIRDHRGGGRSSARTTAAWVAGGSLAEQLLPEGVEIIAWVDRVGTLSLDANTKPKNRTEVDQSDIRCPEASTAAAMEALVKEVKAQGDSLGGTIRCIVRGVPAGWGEPQFNKLSAALGHAMLSINAVKGFEIGDGFAIAQKRGSEVQDLFEVEEGQVKTSANHSGGLQGGISNGAELDFRVAFKPVSSIAIAQQTITKELEKTEIKIEGRHDPLVLPRAVPIVESLTALVLANFYLLQKVHS
ncbi:MAG: chorismate synthase [Bacteroidetes bacterium]|nr:MAG: chorismate synthase [Bacteroidota bacterium]